MKILLVTLLMIFTIAVLVIELFLYGYRNLRNPNRGKIHRRLKTFSTDEQGEEVPDLIRIRLLSNVPTLNKIREQIPGMERLDIFLQQANASQPLGVFMLLAPLLATISFYISSLLTTNYPISVMSATLAGGMPFFYLYLKKKKRMEKFLRQLPEALEMIARALRSGHAFSSGMKLAADNFDDPLGTEFEQTLDEINFGVSVSDALKDLARRVDCPDLKFFVVSVILQREVGGNLAEIMDSISRIIRERFKFDDKVRVLSAEGKVSAFILISLPFLVATALFFLNRDYITLLLEDPSGRKIAVTSLIMMITGVFLIKRMVNIKV